MAENVNTVTVSPTQLAVIIEAVILNQYPVFIWGPPGVGKSAIVKQVTTKLQRRMIDLRAPLLDPVDLRGVPAVDKKTNVVHWARPVFLPTNNTDKVVLFCDELNAAPRMMQASFYQLILDRKVGETVLGKNVAILGAGNREMDGGVVYQMPTPLASRFHTHVELTVDHDQWIYWANKNGVVNEVVQYIRMRPDMLHDFNPKSGERSFPCPRTWEFVSDNIKLGLDDGSLFAMNAGCIGHGAANEFEAFRRTATKIQSPSLIIKNPMGARVPSKDEPALIYATIGALARVAKPSNFAAILKFGDRLAEKFAVLLFRDCLAINPDCAGTEAAARWTAAHSELFQS